VAWSGEKQSKHTYGVDFSSAHEYGISHQYLEEENMRSPNQDHVTEYEHPLSVVSGAIGGRVTVCKLLLRNGSLLHAITALKHNILDIQPMYCPFPETLPSSHKTDCKFYTSHSKATLSNHSCTFLYISSAEQCKFRKCPVFGTTIGSKAFESGK
jgi:hypothetical protein